MLQNATPLRKWAPWPPNISHEHVFCTAPATENASFQILFKCPMPAILFGDATKPSRFAHFWQCAQSLAPAKRNEIWMSKSGPSVVCFVHVLRATTACTFSRHLNFRKWSENGVLCTFWPRNVLRATTACTFSTSQLPKVVRTWCALYNFDFEMCFAPQRHALFRHLNFQKWSEAGVLCTFWLGNVLRATTACTFSSLIWPDGSAPAALASLLFDPPEPQIIGKTQCFATFLPFRASASSFFWLFLFYHLLSSTLLFSLPLPHLRFSSVHIVGSLTSKLPSIITIISSILTRSRVPRSRPFLSSPGRFSGPLKSTELDTMFSGCAALLLWFFKRKDKGWENHSNNISIDISHQH